MASGELTTIAVMRDEHILAFVRCRCASVENDFEDRPCYFPISITMTIHGFHCRKTVSKLIRTSIGPWGHAEQRT